MTPGLPPLKLSPIPVARPWGGRALVEMFGKPAPQGGEPLGESWEATDVAGRTSRIASPGDLKGRTVRDVLGFELPLLVKLLDAREWLSVQVHPDDAFAREREDGAAGKEEAWHILRADPGAEIIWGFARETSREEAILACRTGRIDGVLQRVAVRAGDTVYVPPGTVHAIGPGIVLYEVQQPSDVTYRLFDWGRAREMHLDKGGAVIDVSRRGDPRRPAPAAGRARIVEGRAFSLDRIALEAGGRIEEPPGQTLHISTLVAGSAEIRGDPGGREPMVAGDTFLAVSRGAGYRIEAGPDGAVVLRAAPAAGSPSTL